MDGIRYAREMNPIMWEYPFFRMDMTIEEYNEEKEYFGRHFQDYHAGNYVPLWKQRLNKEKREA